MEKRNKIKIDNLKAFTDVYNRYDSIVDKLKGTKKDIKKYISLTDDDIQGIRHIDDLMTVYCETMDEIMIEIKKLMREKAKIRKGKKDKNNDLQNLREQLKNKHK